MRATLAAALLLVLAVPATAGHWLWDVFCPGRLPPPRGCPDDYRCKPQPPLPPAFCPCGEDDYRCKAKPPLPPEYCPKGCDDYRRKPAVDVSCDAPGVCVPTDGAGPKPPCWWLRCPWWGGRLTP